MDANAPMPEDLVAEFRAFLTHCTQTPTPTADPDESRPA